MKELTNKVVEFTKERDWDQFHSPENLAKSISTAELLAVILGFLEMI